MSANPQEFMLLLACGAPWGELVLSQLMDAGYLAVWASTVTELREALGCSEVDLLVAEAPMLDSAAGRIKCPAIALLADASPAAIARTLRERQATVCLPAPPDPEVLLAQTERLLALGPVSPVSYDLRRSDQVATWRLDVTAWELHSPCQQRIGLTQRETCFLAELATVPGMPVARHRLIAALGFDVRAYDYRRMDMFISRLRSKIARQTSSPLPLRCVHAHGYSFAGTIVKTEG